MAGPLKILECLVCGHVERYLEGDTFCPACADEGEWSDDTKVVRVFREEDVRPLWEGAEVLREVWMEADPTDEPCAAEIQVAEFPAPEEWKR